MNDGVTACINVLRSAIQQAESAGKPLIDASDRDLIDRLHPYGEALAAYLATFSPDARRDFRSLRGGQGQARATWQLQKGIRDRLSSFDPPGLSEFLAREESQTTDEARRIILDIEAVLQRVVVDGLKAAFEGERWWFDGVPESVRIKVGERIEREKGKTGGREQNFDLIDYKSIVLQNWDFFQGILGSEQTGGKEKRTHWMLRVNEIRKPAMHASRGAGVSFPELEELKGYQSWLLQRTKSPAA